MSPADRIKATGKASLATLVIKGRPGKMQALPGRKWESWLPGACRRLRYSMAFLLWSSPVSAPTTAPESQTKAGAGRKKEKEPPAVGDKELESTMGPDETHPQGLRALKWMKCLSHYPSYLRSHGSLDKFPLTGKGKA